MWPYTYKVDGVDLVDNNGPCKQVVIDQEVRAALRGSDRDIAWREGQYHTANKRRTGVDIPLRLLLRDRNADNSLSHPDGHEGHIQQNRQRVKALFGPGQHTLSRTAPHVGLQQISVEAIGEIGQVEKGVDLAVCHAAFPFWRELPAKTATATFAGNGNLPVVVDGDAAIPDAKITILADTQPVTNARVQIVSTGRFVQYADTIAAGQSVVIDTQTCTAVHSSLGRVDRALLRGHADTFVMPRGTYNLQVTADAGTLDFDITVAWNDLRET